MKMHVLKACFTLAWATVATLPGAVAGETPAPPKEYPTLGTIERLDPELDAILAPDARIEKLAGGFEWAEGPVWDRKTGTLLFSDVPRNIVFQWREGVGTRDFLLPSGFTGARPGKAQTGNKARTA